MHVFCSSLSFQQASVNVCTSNISHVTAGFVKIVVYTPPENERCRKKQKKCEENSTFGSTGSVREKVSALFVIKTLTIYGSPGLS